MLELDQIGVSFGEKEVLRDINLSIKEGAFTTLLGPSGCGKSTLLRVIAELLPFSTGKLSYLQNKEPSKSMVFQDAQLLPWRNVKSNVQLSLDLGSNESSDVMSMLDKVGLKAVARKYPSELSGGMKMRVSLARALIGKPDLLLMDEPFGALDEITRGLMGEEVLKFRAWWSSSVVMVTHSIEEALFLSDRILVMPLEPGSWVLDHVVEVEGQRDAEWKRSDSFREQSDLLSSSIRTAMGKGAFS